MITAIIRFLFTIFISVDLFGLSWKPYNGGLSYNFNLYLLGIGGIQSRYLFQINIERFYQWDEAKIDLDILFFHVLEQKT